MTEALYLRQMELGPMQNFVYLVGDRETGDCVVIDGAWDVDAIVRTAEADGMRIVGALVTHGHQDHVGGSLAEWGLPGRIPGLEELLARVPARVYVQRTERPFSTGLGSDLVKVDGGTELQVGRVGVTFIHTPGHTPGSQCFLVDGHLISGDTLFIGGCGRTDLPGGDPAQLHESLARLSRLPDDTLLFPGHNYGGPASSIGDEKQRNPFMRFGLGDFLRATGGGRISPP